MMERIRNTLKWIAWATPNWCKIGKIIDHKIWNIALFFFILMPIIANTLKNFPKEMNIELFKVKYVLVLELPFPWWLLYFAAMFISIAKIYYAACSPSFIKEFPDYTVYQKSDRGGGYLQKILHELVPFWRKLKKDKDVLINYAHSFHSQVHFLNQTGVEKNINNEIWGASSGSFWLVYDLANYSRAFARLVCASCISLASMCFIWIAYIKIDLVVKLLLK